MNTLLRLIFGSRHFAGAFDRNADAEAAAMAEAHAFLDAEVADMAVGMGTTWRHAA